MLVGAMSERFPHWLTAISIAVLAVLSACAAGQLPVVEKLDDLTAVTITYSRAPLVLSTDTSTDLAPARDHIQIGRDYVQIGAIEVNRMGALQYYLWLGISDATYTESADKRPNDFDSIVFIADDDEFKLDVHGWTPGAIGTSEPVYKKLFRSSVDAYYQVTLEQIRLLTEADDIKLRTTASAPKEYVLSYRPAEDDLAAFLRAVLQ